jgi:hypothetical protein
MDIAERLLELFKIHLPNRRYNKIEGEYEYISYNDNDITYIGTLLEYDLKNEQNKS